MNLVEIERGPGSKPIYIQGEAVALNVTRQGREVFSLIERIQKVYRIIDDFGKLED